MTTGQLTTESVKHDFKFFCAELYTAQELTEEFRTIYTSIVLETGHVPNLFDIRMHASNLMQRAFIERIALGKEDLLDDYAYGEGIVAHIQDIVREYRPEEFSHGIFRCIQEYPTLYPNDDWAEPFLEDALYIFNINQWRYHNIECYPAYNFMLLSDERADILGSQGKKEFDINNPVLEVW